MNCWQSPTFPKLDITSNVKMSKMKRTQHATFIDQMIIRKVAENMLKQDISKLEKGC